MITNVKTTDKKDINVIVSDAKTNVAKGIKKISSDKNKTDKNNIIAKINDVVKLTNCNNYTPQFYGDYCKKNNINKLTPKHAKQCRQRQRTILFKIVDNVLYTNAKFCDTKQIQDKFKTDNAIVKNFMQMYKHNYLLCDYNANNMFKGGEDKIKQLQIFLNNVKLFLSSDKNKTDKTKKQIDTKIIVDTKTDTQQ